MPNGDFAPSGRRAEGGALFPRADKTVRLLLGQLAYLNTRPFEPLRGARVFRGSPAEIGRLARAAELDGGLFSAADLFTVEDRYSPIGDPGGSFGIACREQAGSVFLLSRREPSGLGGEVVEITNETSTSVLLLRLYLEHRLGIEPPRYRPGVTRRHEAALLIGDAALREREHPDPAFSYRLDLAAAWREWTGLPFVFAVWSARRSLTENARAGLRDTIAGGLERGVERIPEIAERAAGPLGEPDTLARYLADFTYRFGESEREGLALFRREVRAKGLVEPAPGFFADRWMDFDFTANLASPALGAAGP